MRDESLEQPSPLRNVPSVTTGGAYIGPDECPAMGDEGEKVSKELFKLVTGREARAIDHFALVNIASFLRQVERETLEKAMQGTVPFSLRYGTDRKMTAYCHWLREQIDAIRQQAKEGA